MPFCTFFIWFVFIIITSIVFMLYSSFKQIIWFECIHSFFWLHSKIEAINRMRLTSEECVHLFTFYALNEWLCETLHGRSFIKCVTIFIIHNRSRVYTYSIFTPKTNWTYFESGIFFSRQMCLIYFTFQVFFP